MARVNIKSKFGPVFDQLCLNAEEIIRKTTENNDKLEKIRETDKWIDQLERKNLQTKSMPIIAGSEHEFIPPTSMVYNIQKKTPEQQEMNHEDLVNDLFGYISSSDESSDDEIVERPSKLKEKPKPNAEQLAAFLSAVNSLKAAAASDAPKVYTDKKQDDHDNGKPCLKRSNSEVLDVPVPCKKFKPNEDKRNNYMPKYLQRLVEKKNVAAEQWHSTGIKMFRKEMDILEFVYKELLKVKGRLFVTTEILEFHIKYLEKKREELQRKSEAKDKDHYRGICLGLKSLIDIKNVILGNF